MIRRAIEWLSTDRAVIVSHSLAALACAAVCVRQVVEGQPWGAAAWGAMTVFWLVLPVRVSR